MEQMQFTIMLAPDEEEPGAYNVLVRELPGCYTHGKSVYECLSRAAEAIAGWLGAAGDQVKPGEGDEVIEVEV